MGSSYNINPLKVILALVNFRSVHCRRHSVHSRCVNLAQTTSVREVHQRFREHNRHCSIPYQHLEISMSTPTSFPAVDDPLHQRILALLHPYRTHHADPDSAASYADYQKALRLTGTVLILIFLSQLGANTYEAISNA